jgi:hypothetical protein
MTYQDPKIQARVRSCRSCSAPIIWLRTVKGKKMPVDASSVTGDETLFEYGKHVSHFSTCPNSEKHRRRK